MSSIYVKLVVFVPVTHADTVRQALGEAGAGKMGNYDFCSFSTLGTGRFCPGDGANPVIGIMGEHEEVAEERIETIVPRETLPDVLAAMKEAHPYDEVAYDVYAREDA